MQYFLSSILLFILSSVGLFLFGRRWSKQVWLWLNYVWLLSTLFSVLSVIPLAVELSRDFELRFAERQVSLWEKNGTIGLAYLDWVDDVKAPDDISYFGPAETRTDNELQASLRKEHQTRYDQAQQFKAWATQLNVLLFQQREDGPITTHMQQFVPTDSYVAQLYRWTRENVQRVLDARKISSGVAEDIYSRELKRFTIFCFAFLLPIALGIPVVRNTLDLRK